MEAPVGRTLAIKFLRQFGCLFLFAYGFADGRADGAYTQVAHVYHSTNIGIDNALSYLILGAYLRDDAHRNTMTQGLLHKAQTAAGDGADCVL